MSLRLGVIGGILVAIIVIILLVHKWGKDERHVGAETERAHSNEQTINAVETANAVHSTFSADDRAMYAECLRSARTPANCSRLLPH